MTATVQMRTGADIDLPPVYRLVTLRETGDAFSHARAIAAEEGAGTFVWVRRYEAVEAAIVLEPEEALATARRTLYAGLNALADALAAWAPPERPIEFDWPDTLRFDGAILGGARLAWAPGTAEDAVPDWMVLGVMLRTASVRVDDSGQVLIQGTTLEDEGFDMTESYRLVESFARQFMVQVDLWQDKGFKPVGEQWLARLPRDARERRGIDANGDLLIHGKDAGPAERRALLPLLAAPTWLDPGTGEPRL